MTMSAPGVTFRRITSCHLSGDDDRLVVWIQMSDGSLRSIWWPLADVVERAGEISPAEHAPEGVTLQ